MKKFLYILLLLTSLESKDIIGKVIGIIDGDSIKVLEYLDSGKLKIHKVHLENIYAPTKGQPFSKTSKQTLSKLIFNKWVYIKADKQDRYGNYIGTVYAENLNINQEQIKLGMAWVYRKYCNDSMYYVLEEEARNNFIGLWSKPNPIPPWDFTVTKKSYKPQYFHSNNYQTVNLNQSSSNFRCEGKRYCRQMYSCKEAYFYMNECGLYRLDGDHDGVPCESICGRH